MTAPVQPAPEQSPAQAPVVQPAPDPAAVPVPAPAADMGAPWPPDEQTLLQLQMDARFSIIEESGDGGDTDGADQQAPPPSAPVPAPVQQAPQQPPVKE